MEHQCHYDDYYPLDPLFPGLDPSIDLPSPMPPLHSPPPARPPPPQPAPAPSIPPHKSATRSHSTAPSRGGPELSLPMRGQPPHRSGHGPYTCSEKNKDGTICGKTFKLLKDFNRHLKTIHPSKNDKPFACRCGKQDYRLDNLNRHMKKCTFADKTVSPSARAMSTSQIKPIYGTFKMDAESCEVGR